MNFSLEVIKLVEVLYGKVTDERSVHFEEEEDWQKANKCATAAWLAWLYSRSPQCRYRVSQTGFSVCAAVCSLLKRQRGTKICFCLYLLPDFLWFLCASLGTCCSVLLLLARDIMAKFPESQILLKLVKNEFLCLVCVWTMKEQSLTV